ncbi:17.6 kDa class II heat shock protein-like [Camellia sinensis]|uniref:17.6 kDa class II heat shock protein-like n=1 Tax=Camellia sinensis TaxID=4442 RepID=UPI001035BA75|nr:17.6 kDa class II heat shock protein-like [Camellia sinensis]
MPNRTWARPHHYIFFHTHSVRTGCTGAKQPNIPPTTRKTRASPSPSEETPLKNIPAIHLDQIMDDSPKAEIHWTKTIDQQHIPGLKSGDIEVQVEGDNVLVISGERKREEQKDGAKYLRMERRDGKLMRKFLLLENANTDQISTFCQDGVFTEFLWI